MLRCLGPRASQQLSYRQIRCLATLNHKNAPTIRAMLGLARPEWRLLGAGSIALFAGTAAQIAIPIGFAQMVTNQNENEF
jgi:hypothetical protein